MAKKQEENSPISIKDVTADNIDVQLENAGKFSKEIIEMAKKNRDEKDAKKAADEFDELSQKSGYFNLRLVMMAKMYKDAYKACEEARDGSLKLFERVEAGELDAIGFENEQKKLAKELTKKIDAIQEKQRDSKTRLRNKFPNGNWWSWDNEFFNNVRAAIRRMTENDQK